MKLTHYLYIIGTTVTALTACQSDDVAPRYTVGEDINEIRLAAGVGESLGAGVSTRAAISSESDDHHSRHKNFKTGTAMTLRFDGTWLGHSPEQLQCVTDATIGSTTTGTDKTHNEVVFAAGKKLFWDDFGTADPANKVTNGGRDQGLTIYGVAVDGVTTAPTVGDPSLTSADDGWRQLAWELDTDQKSKGWATKDLLTSNNIQPLADGVSYATDGTLKFDHLYPTLQSQASNLLEFTHAMTKITVVLTAGEGFPGYATSAADAKFAKAPDVTLLGFNYKGKVNVISKNCSDVTTTPEIQMHLSDGGATHTATYDALVFPGNTFADNVNILKLVADGNVYYVTAAKLNQAIQTAIADATNSYPALTGDLSLKQAWNYKLKITVNKTEIKVTATIVDWQEVEAAVEPPLIDVSEAYGHPSQEGHKAFTEPFTLYRSTTLTGSYIADGNNSVVSYDETDGYTLSPKLYWPDHNTHYFFRGVWPQVDGKDASNNPIGPASANVLANAVVVKNVTYQEGTYPSDLMVGAPLLTDDETLDETCKVAAHKKDGVAPSGICATEGKVHINFRYMMSQVEVRLTTNEGAKDAVNLTNAKVEIVNGYTQANVALSSRSIVDRATVADFELGHVDGEDANIRHSAIVPQSLTFTTAGAATNLRFKITIYKDGDPVKGVDDIYYTDINPIKKQGSSIDKVAPNGEWESGVHYVYNLDIRKTELKVSATIKDWITVTAKEDIWF